VRIETGAGITVDRRCGSGVSVGPDRRKYEWIGRNNRERVGHLGGKHKHDHAVGVGFTRRGGPETDFPFRHGDDG
jgi:hypothetical protein